MRNFLVLFIVCAASILSADILKIGSFNVLGTYPQDAEFSRERAKLAAELVNYRDFDVIGLQEAQFWQVEAMLAPGIYKKSGVNVYGEELSPKTWWANIILYKKDKFELLDSGTFWLTDTPDKKSVPKKGRTLSWYHPNSRMSASLKR